jgi:hypothetical protein
VPILAEEGGPAGEGQYDLAIDDRSTGSTAPARPKSAKLK